MRYKPKKAHAIGAAGLIAVLAVLVLGVDAVPQRTYGAGGNLKGPAGGGTGGTGGGTTTTVPKGIVIGFKKDGADANTSVATPTLVGPGGTFTLDSNPFSTGLIDNGTYTSYANAPAGYKTEYWVCYSGAGCSAPSYTQGSSTTVTVNGTGAVDDTVTLWWRYTSLSCTFDGQTVANGGSVTAYQSQMVSTGTCDTVKQTRTCTDGVLSGTYQYGSCSVSAVPAGQTGAITAPTQAAGTATSGTSTFVMPTAANMPPPPTTTSASTNSSSGTSATKTTSPATAIPSSEMTGATTVGTASTTKQVIPPASLAAKAEPGKIATATQAASQKEVPTKQLAALPGTKTAASPSTTATNGTGKKPCVILTKTLTVGSKSPEVVALKKFLSDQKLLTGVTMTDYFGAQTAEALKKWQKNNKIVSSGTAATTGYGATGVKTRKALGTCK